MLLQSATICINLPLHIINNLVIFLHHPQKNVKKWHNSALHCRHSWQKLVANSPELPSSREAAANGIIDGQKLEEIQHRDAGLQQLLRKLVAKKTRGYPGTNAWLPWSQCLVLQ